MSEEKRRGRPPKAKEAQIVEGYDATVMDYARRVFNGQSIDLPMKDRLARVVAALEKQGMDTSGITEEHING